MDRIAPFIAHPRLNRILAGARWVERTGNRLCAGAYRAVAGWSDRAMPALTMNPIFNQIDALPFQLRQLDLDAWPSQCSAFWRRRQKLGYYRLANLILGLVQLVAEIEQARMNQHLSTAS